MITLAKSFYDVNGNFLGVTGLDMLIESINNIISQVQFRETGKVSLFYISDDDDECAGANVQPCGIVVADKEYDLSSEDLTLHSDLQEPPLASTVWNDIMPGLLPSTNSCSCYQTRKPFPKHSWL